MVLWVFARTEETGVPAMTTRHHHHGRKPTLHPYVRISDPTQRKGGGLERQTTANVNQFAQAFGFAVTKRILIDDGVSAFRGLNATPEHQLGQFLEEAKKGDIPPGDCLLLENYDRLSRQDPWAAIGLVNDLRQLKIHVGRLDRGKLLRYDSTDYGDFFEAGVEFMRGNSESAAKSFRNKSEWARKRDRARDQGDTITNRLPAWIEEHNGERVAIPDRAATIQRIFALASRTYGHAAIVRKLTEEGIPPFGEKTPLLDEEGQQVMRKNKKGIPNLVFAAPQGKRLGAGHWSRAYIALLLKDCRVLGELQPRHRRRSHPRLLPGDHHPRGVLRRSRRRPQALEESPCTPPGVGTARRRDRPPVSRDRRRQAADGADPFRRPRKARATGVVCRAPAPEHQAPRLPVHGVDQERPRYRQLLCCYPHRRRTPHPRPLKH
jgi:hypothetical protein